MNRRAYSIDLLRGLAIIGMVLSGQIAHHVRMPAWLFHAQTPPPDFLFNPSLAGITWVDLVFPFFLFSMGAAFPFSLGRKLDGGTSRRTVAWSIVKRGALLAFFAIVLGNTSFWLLHEAVGNTAAAVCLTGVVWAAFFALFVRLPRFSARANDLLNLGGGVALAAILGLYWALGVDVSIFRSDVIMLILSNVVVAGSFVWWLTRRNPTARLAVVAFVVAMKLTATVDGSWNEALWNGSFAPWLFRPEYLQYLCIVLPGSIAGDLVARWLAGAQALPSCEKSTVGRGVYLAAGLALLLVVCNMWGLYARELVANLVLSVVLGGTIWWLLRREGSADGRMLRDVFAAGFAWLLLGLIFEAAEGGVKKDFATVSYFFITSGLASCVVLIAAALLDMRSRQAGFVVRCGQNPMVAYTAAGYVVVPLLYALSFAVPMPWLTGYTGCAMGIGRGVLITLLMMLITDLFTRRKLFWRA